MRHCIKCWNILYHEYIEYIEYMAYVAGQQNIQAKILQGATIVKGSNANLAISKVKKKYWEAF